MKKKLAALLAAVMVLATGITAYAAPSVTTATADTKNVEKSIAVLAEGVTISSDGIKIDGVDKAVTPQIKTVSSEKVAAAKEAAKSLVSEKANLLKMVDVSLPVDFKSATITFDVSGVKAGQKVAVLHQKADGTWEKISDVTVTDGKVTATFTSLSPIAFVVEGTSDKTGAAAPVLSILALICLAGIVICGAKVKTLR